MLRLAEADPGRLVVLASEVTERARAEGDVALESIAERAWGVAAVHLQDLETATRHFRAAIRLGRRAGSAELAAEALIRLAFVTSLRGRPKQALNEIGRALPDLHGVARARAEAQRAAVFNHLGRLDDALACYRTAVPVLRRAGDHLWLQRVLSNRGIVHGYRHEFGAAESDLREAEKLCRALGLDLSLAIVRLNLGWVSALRGDVPAALNRLDLAEGRFRALGTHQLGWLLSDRAGLLLSVGLVAEARQAAQEAVEELQHRHRKIGLPEVRLLLARAALLQGDHEHSQREARRAVSEFTRQHRPEWAALARFVVLRSRITHGVESQAVVGALERSAIALTAAGWPAMSMEARLLAAQAALGRGWIDRGCRQLEQAGLGRLRGPALLRAQAWHAEALLRLTRGNRRGASVAVRTGLRVLDEHRATLGATDLRAYSAQYRVDLARLGLRMAFQSGRPSQVFDWAEQGRAIHLLMKPARPPDDPMLAKAMTELRATVGEIHEMRTAGRDTARLVQHQIALEREIRDYCRKLPPGRSAAPAGPVSIGALAEPLRNNALIEFVQLDEELHALALVDGRLSLRPLGPVAPVRDLLDRVPFALRRLAARSTTAGRAAAEAMLRHAAARLDAILLGPLARVIADRPLVVIPTGCLQALPWSILPSCAGRAVTVSPSATLWHTAFNVRDADGYVLAVAGPGLPGARAEAEAVGGIHSTSPLVGPEATAEAVITALDGARLAHLAAHGRLHATNPLFSSLRLADGPLTIYDLERLHRAPRMVILAACDSGRSVVRAGDELLGLSATFLALGARTIIAPVMSVPDTETAPVMVALHRLLRAGHSAADALARTQRAGEDLAAASAGFVCIGADMTLPPVRR